MRWDTEWGASEQWLWEQSEADGKMMPPLLRKPELNPFEEIVWNAFQALRFDRQYGFGAVGQIMWTALDRYAQRYAIEGDVFEVFVRLVHAIDAEWLKPESPDADDN